MFNITNCSLETRDFINNAGVDIIFVFKGWFLNFGRLIILYCLLLCLLLLLPFGIILDIVFVEFSLAL
jgi:hypothetical protein